MAIQPTTIFLTEHTINDAKTIYKGAKNYFSEYFDVKTEDLTKYAKFVGERAQINNDYKTHNSNAKIRSESEFLTDFKGFKETCFAFLNNIDEVKALADSMHKAKGDLANFKSIQEMGAIKQSDPTFYAQLEGYQSKAKKYLDKTSERTEKAEKLFEQMTTEDIRGREVAFEYGEIIKNGGKAPSLISSLLHPRFYATPIKGAERISRDKLHTEFDPKPEVKEEEIKTEVATDPKPVNPSDEKIKEVITKLEKTDKKTDLKSTVALQAPQESTSEEITPVKSEVPGPLAESKDPTSKSYKVAMEEGEKKKK
jgi:predicted RNA-binding protein with PIN domain